MTNWRAIYLTARRELRERVRTRAFLISTAVQIAIVAAIAGGGSALLGGNAPDSFDVGYVGADARAVVEGADESAGSVEVKITPTTFDSQPAARAAVEGGDIEVAVVATGDEGRILTGSDPPEVLTPLLQSAAQDLHGTEILQARGLSESEARAALHPQPLEVTTVGDDSATGLAFLGSLLLYVSILWFGSVVATAVNEEKSTRVVEIILSAIRPFQLLAGKVLGIGLLGIGQLVLIAGTGIAVALGTDSFDFPGSTPEAAILVAACFVLGFFMYAAAFAVAGAIVSRQEDVQSAQAPLMILLVLGFVAVPGALDDPSGTLARVLTFLPPVAPMIVPGRAVLDALPAWELAVSLTEMVLFAGLLLWLAARIYERAILRTGAPLKLPQAIRLLGRGHAR